MIRPVPLLASACLLTARAPSGGDAAAPPPPADALGAACENGARGYHVRYPDGWHTNGGGVVPACSLFDSRPVEVQPATEVPFDVAVAIRREDVPFETVTGERRGQRVLVREETTVGGRDAVRMELKNTGALLRPEGSRSYQYAVDLDGAVLLLSTYDAGDLPYERKREILDRMADSLRFTGS